MGGFGADRHGMGDPVQEGQLVAGRYRLVRVVGAGGMGEVWLAHDERDGRLVALKAAGSGPDTGRGVRAMQTATQLGHRHVVGLLGTVQDGNVQWLLMEYVRSASLDRILAKSPTPQVRQVAALGEQMASALAAVHAEGVVHRDVKPGNILIAPDGTAKLADFGISRVSWGDPTVTNSGQVGGTPAYMGTEVANGEDPTTASDVFSLGATLFAALEGQSVYGVEQNPLKTLRKASKKEIGRPERSGALTALITQMLSPEPADRPTAAQAQHALAEIAAGSPVPSVPASLLGSDRLPERTRGWLTRRRGRMLGVAGVTLAVVAVLLVVFVSGMWRQPRKPVSAAAPSASAAKALPVATMGDERTADPCALLKTSDFGKYGDTVLEPSQGGFNRCDVVVHQGTSPAIQVKIFLENDVPLDVEGAKKSKVGPVTLVRLAPTNGDCERDIHLVGGATVIVDVEQDSPTKTNLCTVADIGTQTALGIVTKQAVPRRPAPFAAASLATLDACALLDATALTGIPGLGKPKPQRHFGNWSCTWEGSETSIDVKYNHNNEPPTAGTQLKVPGRTTFLQANADGEHMCLAEMQYRPAVDLVGQPTIELVDIEADRDNHNGSEMCGPAGTLARTIAGELPAV